jgi:hypothetical protein
MQQCVSSPGGKSLRELCKKTVTFFRVGETSPLLCIHKHAYRVAQKGLDTAFLLFIVECEMDFASLCISYSCCCLNIANTLVCSAGYDSVTGCSCSIPSGVTIFLFATITRRVLVHSCPVLPALNQPERVTDHSSSPTVEIRMHWNIPTFLFMG